MATGQAKNRHVEFQTGFQTKFDSLPVRFSQSELLPTSSDGTVASSKDVERIPLHCFSRPVIHHFLSGLTEVFFARAMHSTSVIR